VRTFIVLAQPWTDPKTQEVKMPPSVTQQEPDLYDYGCTQLPGTRPFPQHLFEDSQGSDVLYRVDSLRSMRSLITDPILRPRRWDTQQDPWKHKALLEAQTSKTEQQGIYSISFWTDPDAAWRDLQCRGISTTHVLTRVQKSVVQSTFSEWHHEEDDSLQGEAALIWTCRSANDFSTYFYNDGVSVDQFEVLDNNQWVPWNEALNLLPDRVRLTRQGWQPIAMKTTQGGATIAYWMAVRMPDQLKAKRGHWLLLTLDETARGSLGSDDAAIARVTRDLCMGPLHALHTDLEGIMTLYPTRDKLWTQTFDVSIDPVHQGSWWKRMLHKLLDMQEQYIWTAKQEPLLTQQQTSALIRASRLSIAKPEFPDWIWKTA
jgi:hypothetical protein